MKLVKILCDMRNKVKFILLILQILFCLSCEGPFVLDEELIQEKEPRGKVISEDIVVQFDDAKVYSKNLNNWGRSYYLTNIDNVEKFLFYICEFDCNEKIQKYQFENEHIAFLIKGSTRFRSKNRLILYRINKNESFELLDTVSEVYTTFRFESNKFIYVLENGTEKSIVLNE